MFNSTSLKGRADAIAAQQATVNAIETHPSPGSDLSQARAALASLAADHLVSTRQQARESYEAGKAEFFAAIANLHTITAKTDAAARVASELSRQIDGRVGDEAHEWANGILKNLKTPVIPGGLWNRQWHPEDAHAHANERVRPHLQAATASLEAAGISIPGVATV